MFQKSFSCVNLLFCRALFFCVISVSTVEAKPPSWKYNPNEKRGEKTYNSHRFLTRNHPPKQLVSHQSTE